MEQDQSARGGRRPPRPKVGLSRAEQAAAAAIAAEQSLPLATYIRHLVIADISLKNGSLQAAGQDGGNPAGRGPSRVKVSFTEEEILKVESQAKRISLPVSRYIKQLVLWDVGDQAARARPSEKRNRRLEAALHDLNAFSVLLRRHANNVNQLARQANTAMVPITRNEAQLLLDKQQLVMSNANALLHQLMEVLS